MIRRLKRLWCWLRGHRLSRSTRLVAHLDFAKGRATYSTHDTCLCGLALSPAWSPKLTLDRPICGSMDDDVVYRSREA